jgi:Lon-like ATP-dependent protease
VSTVEEGIEILTGVPAGDRGPSGMYSPDSIFGRTDRRLGELAEAIKEFGPLEG